MKKEIVTTFGELRNGDVFRIVGLRNTPEDLAHRKASKDRAFALQDGCWQTIPPEWPVVIVDPVCEVARRDFGIEVNAETKGESNA